MPEKPIELTTRFALPLLVTTTVRFEEASRSTSPKFSEVGDTPILGAAMEK